MVGVLISRAQVVDYVSGSANRVIFSSYACVFMQNSEIHGCVFLLMYFWVMQRGLGRVNVER